MSLIEIKDAYYAYNDTKNAIDGITFNIEKGTYTTIIGHNGSGKSTLAKMIAGLLEIKKGDITIDGVSINQDNIAKIREQLGIVFQNPDNQFIGSTVRDDIAFGLENKRVPQEEMDDIINKYAGEVGLLEYLDKEPHNLSGGQKQRVAIAGILAMKPNIIIFDEATSMLDPKGKKDIKKLMYNLHKENQLTIVSITHDIEEVLQSDDCVVLNQGKLYMHDKPIEVFKHPNELRKVNLDIPFTAQVKECFLQNKIKLKSNTLEGMVDELWQLSSKN